MEVYINQAISAAWSAGSKILEIYETGDFSITAKKDQSPLTRADRTSHEEILSFLEKTGIPVLSEEGKDIPFRIREKWESFWLVDPLDGTKEFIKRNGEFTVNIALIASKKPVFGVVYVPVTNTLFLGIAGEGSWLYTGMKENADSIEIKAFGTPLPVKTDREADEYRVVASRSHLNQETEKYLAALMDLHGQIDLLTKGSSLKLCMVASGEADEYPRLGPTMEWDIAAAHAVVLGAGKRVMVFGKEEELLYNKEDLLNPWFVVK